jgi:transposase
LHAAEKHTVRIQQMRIDYWNIIKDVKPENLVFIDETGVNLAMIRAYARAPGGERARGARPQRKGKNVSIVGAVALKGLIASFNALGGFNTVTFEAFVCQKLIPNLWPGACVVVDNCKIHKSPEVEAALKKAKARLVFLPPYSPDFNPIENYWSKLKTILRSIEARTYEELDKAIKEAYEQISTQDIRNWFAHDCYCHKPLKFTIA